MAARTGNVSSGRAPYRVLASREAMLVPDRTPAAAGSTAHRTSYARVSTDDKGQDPENQLRQLRAWCASAGHEITREYVDHASGGKGAEKRPEFAAMLADAHKRQFDLVLCWALDRLSREGMV